MQNVKYFISQFSHKYNHLINNIITITFTLVDISDNIITVKPIIR